MRHLTGINFKTYHSLTICRICLQEGLKEKFIEDLGEVTKNVLETGRGNKMEGVSALYGMAQTIPDKTLSKELCHRYLDILYETD